MIVSSAGGVPVELDRTNKDTHGATFSPDGAWIAYTRLASGGSRITKVPSAGGQPIDVANGGNSPGFPISWSPAGDWIAFSPQHGQKLCLVSPDGKSERTLLNNGYWDWAFDRTGARIYGVRRGEGRKWEFWSIEVSTGIEHKIVTLDVPPEQNLYHLSLHPDGKRFLASVEITSSDIWIIDGATVQ